ncbi:5'-3' exonuclease [Bacillus sp. FJAT-50079]|uniref:5'-3' exonuclease n=1 Tax=Bacillus sp. FJAT-50079 TaxID=2833577 RepID=UPI001BCA2B12|nr:5'-3' exonuclease [Bacillus sp. FJAT-50079]MBS4209821.1 5'-3' exonuclease [Bacillus sp. FJAT-50079]
MKKQHLLLVDGMALLFRAFFATSVHRQFMLNHNGVPTNAVQGYMRHLLTALENVNPSHVAVCWDMGSETFRTDLYSGYKANRDAPPTEMIPQFDMAKEITDAFGIPSIGIAGYEADDCIGTLCSQYKDAMNITVLTGDRDLLQIVDERVNVLLLQKGIGNYLNYTKESFIEQYDIQPAQLIDVKALMGDTSDGYPGVRGIGEKTALRLIKTYENIDILLANVTKLTKSQQQKIEEDLDMLHLSRQLAEIKCDVSLALDISQALLNGLPNSAQAFVDEHGLKVVRNHLVKANWFEETNRLVESGI